MWICQGCGNAHDDATETCATCVRSNEAEARAAATRQVRGLGWLVGMTIVCTALGLLLGWMLDSQKSPRLGAEEAELHVGKSTGAFVGAIVGVVAWASFPYKRQPRRVYTDEAVAEGDE